MCVTITPKAAAFMRRMVRFSDDSASKSFRLVVSPGGCSGYASFFTIESKSHPGDREFDAEGTPVFMPESSCELLRGHIIDFIDSASHSGFVFTGPGQPAGCGCGKGKATGLASVPVGNICRKAAEI